MSGVLASSDHIQCAQGVGGIAMGSADGEPGMPGPDEWLLDVDWIQPRAVSRTPSPDEADAFGKAVSKHGYDLADFRRTRGLGGLALGGLTIEEVAGVL